MAVSSAHESKTPPVLRRSAVFYIAKIFASVCCSENSYLGFTFANSFCSCNWYNLRYWSKLYVVLSCLRPPLRKMESIYSLSVSRIGCKFLSYCLFGDLLGTVDIIRYRRNVGVSCPASFRTLSTV